MNREEKIIIACAFRYASVNDIEDVRPIMKVLRENVDSIETEELRKLLDDTRFALQFIGNQKKPLACLREFGNQMKDAIRHRQKEEILYQKRRQTKEMKYFDTKKDFCRFMFVLAIAYAAPRQEHLFAIFDKMLEKSWQDFTTEELELVCDICYRCYPNIKIGTSAMQVTVMEFIHRLKDRIDEKGDEEGGETYLMKSHLAKIIREEDS